ncbi:hypothetical protein [uncultured Erythrobacter sp.]|uniref:hypothetical protein n=1 Tax=uncultured Erythrobacter sp. TaxID=263913 RepID=UPI0026116816|nr:hypothetical protein [uncultured Erythrobacter sp.]
MSKFRNYVLVGAFGLAAVASAMQITFNDGNASASASKAMASVNEVQQPEPAPIEQQTTQLENAIQVAFSGDAERTPEEDKRWRKAVDHLRTSITSRGYRCVVPYEFERIDSTLYGIGCVNNRQRTGQTNYLVNVRTGDVEPL